MRSGTAVLFVLVGLAPAVARDRVGNIEFFGYTGLDLSKIRNAMPVREGDEYTAGTKDQIRRAVADAIGKPPTDVAGICCDANGDRLLFIGIPGASSRTFTYNPPPTGNQRLPAEIMAIYARLDEALEAAVRRGGDAAQEDDSKGYALVKDPAARSLELKVHDWAVRHESKLVQVLQESSDVEHRRVASDALGYANESRGQILALVRAARDPDDEVRNNATRALGVLVRSKPQLADQVPPDAFIDMLNSGIWTDRNKGASLLMQLTSGGNTELLAKIRTTALDSLVEMASWRAPAHAFFARMVLGRVAGIPERRLQDLAWNGPAEGIVEAASRR